MGPCETLLVALSFLFVAVYCSQSQAEGVSKSALFHGDASPLTSTCPGKPNSLAPWSGSLTKVKEVENGSLYTAGDGDDQIYGGYSRIHKVFVAKSRSRTKGTG